MRAANSEYLLAALRNIIKAKGLTYKELAERLGVPLSTFKRHLYSPNITLEKLLDYCQEVGTTLDELQKLAIKLQHDNDSFFSQTQDEIFYQFPQLYDFYRELRHLRQQDSYTYMRKKYGLNKSSTYGYLRALEMLGLVKLAEDNKIQLVGPFYYRFSENSKLSQKYKTILKEQALDNPDCVRVGFSRMYLTEAQLGELNQLLAKEILKYHSENMQNSETEADLLRNVLLFVTQHQPLVFSEGIGSLPHSFLQDVKAAIDRCEAPGT
ncbi:helix-turn-helix domain-containing protein [Photobacterium sp. TY1-4]|uniref:helix-turn-helix domain-containing protein n=1 Tax=Photobacterium sp. TY1-4 TaxID=2899122 RepID=UPI0021C08C5F|nr:helix-turn-helix transcriptional regulator [Photobacterium sp. TY1-4]UXI00923.1 helix-turn-helix domain-containing protein [Photobacterium sp. TY1-4]